jgi:hypothetical protein
MSTSVLLLFITNYISFFSFKMTRGTLILEDGSEFNGFVFGASTNTAGEVGRTILINFFLFYLLLLLFSLSNWYGRLYWIINGPILLWRNSSPYLSTYWKLWFVLHRFAFEPISYIWNCLGVPDEKAVDEFGLLRWVESNKIYASALIVSAYTEQYSHWNAVESLSSWLKKHNVPGLYG